MTSTFTIAGESLFTFEVTTDGDGNLESITASDAEQNFYDCKLQLVPRNPERNLGVECCTPAGCTSGSCGG